MKHGDDVGFILSDEEIPTWWTQLHVGNSLLTGWLGGPRAAKRSNETEESLFQTALMSLSSIFHVSVDELRNDLIHYKIISWQNYPYVNGGYSYNTLNSEKAKKILAEPAEETIFFAGEAYSESEYTGTVESALQSGHDAAEKLLKQYVNKKTTPSV
jgi:monoamine oxidase